MVSRIGSRYHAHDGHFLTTVTHSRRILLRFFVIVFFKLFLPWQTKIDLKSSKKV